MSQFEQSERERGSRAPSHIPGARSQSVRPFAASSVNLVERVISYADEGRHTLVRFRHGDTVNRLVVGGSVVTDALISFGGGERGTRPTRPRASRRLLPHTGSTTISTTVPTTTALARCLLSCSLLHTLRVIVAGTPSGERLDRTHDEVRNALHTDVGASLLASLCAH